MKSKKALVTTLLTVFVLLFSTSVASAAVMWGKTELKKGQIGKVTILENTDLLEFDAFGKSRTVRTLYKGEEYRVYRYLDSHGGLYGLGGGTYVKNDQSVNYETPSKAKLALLNGTSSTTKVMWGKTELKVGQIGKVTILSDVNAHQIINDDETLPDKPLEKGGEYRVYSFAIVQGKVFYGLGAGLYVAKSSDIKYETPSKAKLALIGNPVPDTPVKAHFIDVGQGDSILITLTNGKNILIDGGNRESGKEVVHYLKKAGVNTIDLMVATHPDDEHIGGLIEVLNHFPVKHVLDSGKVHTTETYYEFLQLIGSKNIPYADPQALSYYNNEPINLDSNVTISVLNDRGMSSQNKGASVALKLTYGNMDILLTGDAVTQQELEMLERNNVEAEIYKASHHGSDRGNSLEFLQAVKPKATVLSYGENNIYGLPHKEMVDRLTQLGSSLYSTSVSGNIVFTVTKSDFTVSTNPLTEVISPPRTEPDIPFTLVNKSELAGVELMIVENWEKNRIEQPMKVYPLTEDLFIITAGGKPHPGYSIEIVKTESSLEQVIVYTRIMKPNPHPIFAYPMIIDYPYVIGKSKLASNQSLTFIDSETGEIIPMD